MSHDRGHAAFRRGFRRRVHAARLPRAGRCGDGFGERAGAAVHLGGGHADLRQDAHGQDARARGRPVRLGRERQGEDPGQGRHPGGPAAPDLRGQAARGRPHARRVQHHGWRGAPPRPPPARRDDAGDVGDARLRRPRHDQDQRLLPRPRRQAAGHEGDRRRRLGGGGGEDGEGGRRDRRRGRRHGRGGRARARQAAPPREEAQGRGGGAGGEEADENDDGEPAAKRPRARERRARPPAARARRRRRRRRGGGRWRRRG